MRAFCCGNAVTGGFRKDLPMGCRQIFGELDCQFIFDKMISKQWIFNRYFSQGLVMWWCTSPQEEVNNCDLQNLCDIFRQCAFEYCYCLLWYSLQQSTSGLSDLYRLHFATELIDGTLIINMLLIQKLLLEVMMCLFQCKNVFSNKVQGPNLHSLQSFKLLKQEW